MLDKPSVQNILSLQIPSIIDNRVELNRLLAAAIVNHRFCCLLLEEPELAIQNGFQGETFLFAPEELALILSIRAKSLADLANQLVRTFST
jgi:hypothetical protein